MAKESTLEKVAESIASRNVPKDEAERILESAGVGGDRLFELYLKAKDAELINHAFMMGAIHHLSSFGPAVGCELRVYVRERSDAPGKFYTEEYLIVHYDGGAWAARRANCNSNSANFKEIANLIDGGYYQENLDLEELEEKAYRLILGDNGKWSLRKGKEAN